MQRQKFYLILGELYNAVDRILVPGPTDLGRPTASARSMEIVQRILQIQASYGANIPIEPDEDLDDERPAYATRA
jgi:hypothetical protein